MAHYYAAVFCDLVANSLAWSRVPREQMAAVVAEYRYLAESMASQHGAVHRNFTGDGHLFLFASADAAVQFGLRLIEGWEQHAHARSPAGPIPLRVGCHFGECARLEGEEAWVGRGINLAKRIEGEAEPNSLFTTEAVLEVIDLPVYEFEQAGTRALKGDHLAERQLYRLTSFDRAALASKPQGELSAEGWFLRGVSLVGTEQENSEEEAACYREALRLRPDYAEAHNNLAILLGRRGDLAGAMHHYQEALRLRPDYPEAHYNYGLLLELRGSTRGALERYREALRARPDYVDAHQVCANLLKSLGEAAAAARHYAEALRLRPEYAEAHNNYAILLEDLGHIDDAGEHYREALRIRREYPEAHYNYALHLENRGETGGAEAHYREALRLRPEYPEAHNNLAVLLQTRGDAAGAEEHYREALRLRPDDPETHYNYALILRAKGDGEEAKRHLRIAQELAPNEPAFRVETERGG